MKVFCLCLISLINFKLAIAQTWQDTLAVIESRFARYQPENPGCQLSVSRNGQLIFSKAWGTADLEHQVPNTVSTIFEAGSVSKQFTAAAILLLQQQGKLSLNDNVRKYIPELHDFGTPITLRHLMHHASGLKEWSDLVEMTGWPRGKRFYTNSNVLDLLTHQLQLNFRPGAEFSYSNSNYILLAIIVERVSGMSLTAFTRQYIFDPAGMSHTQWRDDPNRIVPNRAIAYSKSASGYAIEMPNEYVYGPGGLLTTSEDLVKWNNFYQDGHFGSPPLLPEQVKTEPLTNGVINPYAAGIYIRKVMGWNAISHDGATASYRAFLESFPELHLTIAILSNTSQFNIGDVANNVRSIFVPDKTAADTSAPTSFKIPATELAKLPGLYVNERNQSTFHLSLKHDTLLLDNSVPLKVLSNDVFTSSNFLIKLTNGRGAFIPFLPRDTMMVRKVDAVTPTARDLDRYQGSYSSRETNSSIVIQHRGAKMYIHFDSGIDYELIPTYKDAFYIDEPGCDLQFIVGANKQVSGARFYFWRSRGIEFKRSK